MNWDACLFHERQAAQLGCLEAVITIARYSLNMTGHMLHDCPIPPTENDRDCGLDYLWRAADSGDRRSMIELANIYRNACDSESGNEKANTNIGCRNHINTDWPEAVKWYKRAFEADSNVTDNQPEEELSMFSDKVVPEIKKRNRSISFKMSGTVVRDDRNSPMIVSPIFLDKYFPAPFDLMRALSLVSGVLSSSTPFVSHNNLICKKSINENQ